MNCKSSASLVSFQTDQGYDSYYKSQAYNAPISFEAEFAFSTAVKRLIEENSHNKFKIGNRLYLFWASSASQAAKESEDSLFALLGRPETDDDDPNRRIGLVRDTFMAIYNGKLRADKDDKFCILGLAPNLARIAVVYWNEMPLRDFAGVISRHFEDMAILDNEGNEPDSKLYSILKNITRKSIDEIPNMPDAVVKSIFQGLPYPISLFRLASAVYVQSSQ